MPKWNPIFGHLLALNDAFSTKKLPADVQRPAILSALAEDFPETDLYYIDLWPFIRPMTIVTRPDLAIQALQNHDLGKAKDVGPFLWPITGGDNIFTANGEKSRHDRMLFSSGFNPNYILSQTADVVREAEVYVEVLQKYAVCGEIIQLDEVTLNYAMDIAGAMTL